MCTQRAGVGARLHAQRDVNSVMGCKGTEERCSPPHRKGAVQYPLNESRAPGVRVCTHSQSKANVGGPAPRAYGTHDVAVNRNMIGFVFVSRSISCCKVGVRHGQQRHARLHCPPHRSKPPQRPERHDAWRARMPRCAGLCSD